MSKISASRFRQRPIRRAKKVAYDVFLPPCSIWEPVNWAKLGEGEEMRQQRDRKRRFSATSKSSPVVLYGEITDGGCFLFRSSVELLLLSLSTCALLSPPCCTIITSPSAVNELFPLFHHPCTVLSSLLSFPSLLPQSSLPSFLITSPPPFQRGRTPAARVLISLIGGVRMQFHLSSPLHSSTGHSITFRCSDADVAVFGCRWQRVEGEGEGTPLMMSRRLSRSLTLFVSFFLATCQKTNLSFFFPSACFSLCLISPSESDYPSLIPPSSLSSSRSLFLLPTNIPCLIEGRGEGVFWTDWILYWYSNNSPRGDEAGHCLSSLMC